MSLVEHPTNPISGKVLGAAIEVHRNLGPGLLESIYQECLCRELDLRGVQYQREVFFQVQYKGSPINKGQSIDFIVEKALIVETKAVEKLLSIHSAQLMTYMRLTGISAGLLINFNVETLPHGIRRRLL